MAMMGMQSEMQCNFFPRRPATPDLNLNATCSMWPVNNVDRNLQNGHCYNGGLALPFPLQQLACKEVVKQTILHHEAIFRNQIQELHRVYNRQRELVNEVKRNELYGHLLWQKTSSSTSAQSSFQVSSFPWLNPGLNQPSDLGVKSNKSFFNIFEQKVIQGTCDSSQTKHLVEVPELLESKCKKVGRKILDLELPAEEYIDIEEEETCVEETVACIPETQTSHLKTGLEDVKKCIEVSPVTADVNLVVQKSSVNQASFPEKAKSFADLNEPIKPEGLTDYVSNNFLCHVPGLEGIPSPDVIGNTKANFEIELQNVVPRTNEDLEACSNILHHNHNGSQRDCLCDNHEIGKRSSNLEFLHKGVSVDALSISSKEVEIVQAQQISSSAKLDQSSAESKRKRKDVDSECTESDFSSCQYTSNEIVPSADTMDYQSPLVLSSRRHMQNFVRVPIVVQALPCFNSSAQLKRNSRSRSSKYTGANSQRGENVSCNPEFHGKGNCSVFKENFPRKLRRGSADMKFSKVLDLNSLSPCCSSIVESESITVTDGGERLETDVVNKENVNSQVDYHSVPAGEHLSSKQLVRNIQGKRSDLVCIDLNSFINEDDSPSTPSSSVKIYLNAPVSPENKEGSPPRGESDENQLETTSQFSGQDDKLLLQDSEKIAAEVIVSFSSAQDPTCIEKGIIKPFELLHAESLYWFARIVSSVRDDPGSEYGVIFSCKDIDDRGEDLSDGIDYFEAMTLSLKETNTEEHRCKYFVPEEEPKCSSSLQSQLRKGQMRRCRHQKKDFQNEILPGLASLSRYEVTEDLQAFGGVTEVTCGRRGSGARKVGRSGCPRTRRRRVAVSSNVGNAACLTESSDLVAQLRSLAGWTMVTKRHRGQRSRATNPRLILGVA